jgi:C_GCAxxG_C_C family probable redox protein
MASVTRDWLTSANRGGKLGDVFQWQRRIEMKRREFVKTCVAGVTAGGVVLGVPGRSGQAEQSKPGPISPDQLAKAAQRHFLEGKHSCCESVLLAGCEALGIKSELIPDIAIGLAGGIGMQGETCGVLTGSALVLSLAVAKKETEYPKKVMRATQAMAQVHKAFKREFAHTDCRSLTGVDLTTPEGKAKHKADVRAQKCARYVAAAARLLAAQLNTV